MNSGRNDPLLADRVSPFGHLRILGCLLLPEDYRRLTASFIGSDDQGIHHVPLLFSSMTYNSFSYVLQRNDLFVSILGRFVVHKWIVKPMFVDSMKYCFGQTFLF